MNIEVEANNIMKVTKITKVENEKINDNKQLKKVTP